MNSLHNKFLSYELMNYKVDQNWMYTYGKGVAKHMLSD